MTWQVLCAAQSSTVANGDLSIEAAELARADATVMPGLCTSEAEIAAVGERADGLLTLGVGLGRQTLSSLTRCRAIVTASHGYNHLDLAAATELGIPVANTYFCHEDVANHTLLLLLACARKLTQLHQELNAGRWRRDLLGNIPPIYGQTLGLVGLGHIGTAVARRGQALGLDVIASDPLVDAEAMARVGVRRVGLDQVLARLRLRLTAPAALEGDAPPDRRVGAAVDETHRLSAEHRQRWACRRTGAVPRPGRRLDRRRWSGRFRTGAAGPGQPAVGASERRAHATFSRHVERIVAERPTPGGAALAMALNGVWPPNVINPEVRGATRFPFVP